MTKYGLDEYSPNFVLTQGLQPFNFFLKKRNFYSQRLDYANFKNGCVVKPVGLCGGKGVKVSGDHLNSYDEIKSYCDELESAKMPYIIEEKLLGKEFSCMSLTDGNHCYHFPIAVGKIFIL